MYIASTAADCMTQWSFMNAQWQPVFQQTHPKFGPAATLAHAKHWLPRLLEQLKAQPPLKMWCAQPRYVALSMESVEVQQLGRRDVVPPKDITVSREAGDLVLKANAFYEARFIVGETPNVAILMALLKTLAS